MANVLKTAKLDLDDNVILGFQKQSHVDLYEIYKIDEIQELIEYNNVGSWSEKEGLQLINIPKWYRRRNLKVRYSLEMRSLF